MSFSVTSPNTNGNLLHNAGTATTAAAAATTTDESTVCCSIEYYTTAGVTDSVVSDDADLESSLSFAVVEDTFVVILQFVVHFYYFDRTASG